MLTSLFAIVLSHAVGAEPITNGTDWRDAKGAGPDPCYAEGHGHLPVKRDLFDSPGHSPLDGSAHIIIDDLGFLFRGGFDAGRNQTTALRGSIPVNRWLQLKEDPEALYRIKEIDPRQGVDLGVCQYGDEFLYDMPMDPAVILSLEPVPAGSEPRSPDEGGLQNNPAAIPAFSSAALPKPKEPNS